MSPCFHVRAHPVAAGDVIAPGHYGRMIAAAGPAHWRYAREMLLEAVRRRDFPDRPSRLACCFALPDVAQARRYVDERLRAQPGLVTARVYEVVALEAGSHAGDWHLAEEVRDDVSARLYWRGEDDGDDSGRELVVGSALRVVRCLD